jgi:hypothetical protein
MGFFDIALDIISPLHLYNSIKQGIYGEQAQGIAKIAQPILEKVPIVGSLFTDTVSDFLLPDQSALPSQDVSDSDSEF